MRSAKFQKFMNLNSSGEKRVASGESWNSARLLNGDGKPMNGKSEYAAFKAAFNAEADSLDIMMHDVIGDWWVGLDSATVVKQIKDAKGKKVNVDINSFGGDAYAGISIYNALATHDAHVTARITGIAYSAASIIPMAADEIIMAENGSMGIHPAWLYAMGNRFALKDYFNWLETLDNQLIDTYAARTGRTREEIVGWFEGENHDGTVFSGKQCLEYGFADSLIPLKTKKEADAGTGSGNSTAATPRNDIRERLEQVQRTVSAHERQKMLAKVCEQVGVQ